MKLNLRYVQKFKDKYGRLHYYFRKRGCERKVLAGDPNSASFLAVYQACLQEAQVTNIGEGRVAPGSVASVVARYLASGEFQMRSLSTQRTHRRALEKFRTKYADGPLRTLKSEDIRGMLAVKSNTPAMANEFLVALRDMLAFAANREMIPSNPALGIKKLKPKKAGGHHCWLAAEIEQFRAKHPIGSQARATLELMLSTAMRLSDAIRVGRNSVSDGRWHYTQFKNRVRRPQQITGPVDPELIAILKATPGPGGVGTAWESTPFLRNSFNKPWSELAFSQAMRRWCDEAGLPSCCSSHGLRKASATELAELGASVHEIAAITGHTTPKEITRYTEQAERRKLAAAALDKRTKAKTQSVKS
jgi:integrase